jgi:hypothetical protein
VRILVFGIAFAAIVGLVSLALWNALMPAIFGLPAINFWQALGLLLLSRLLLGRFGGWGRQRFRDAMGAHRPAGCGSDQV